MAARSVKNSKNSTVKKTAAPKSVSSKKAVGSKSKVLSPAVKIATKPLKKKVVKAKQKAAPRRSPQAARPATGTVAKARAVKQYEHPTKKRLNNPPVGLVTPETDPDSPPKTYAYDPHLDPQLVWTGKEEKTALTLDTVSLHVHERIDPYTIIESVRNKASFVEQVSLFAKPTENPPMREAVDFYKHQHDWSNRLIAGDSNLVMNSLLEREGMAGQIQMVYMDPPYGIKYGSNFQPFTNKRNVTDGSDDDLTQEPEMIRAFRDTWELGVHSYLGNMRDHLTLANQLLADEGSCFVQISDANVHRVRIIMDEVFGATNFVAQINYRSMMPLASGHIESVYDYVIWYAKKKESLKYRNLWIPKLVGGDSEFVFADTPDGGYRRLTRDEITNIAQTLKSERVFKRSDLASSGYTPSCTFPIEFDGKIFQPVQGKSWRTHRDGIEALKKANRLFRLGEKIYFKMYHDDFGYKSLENSWSDTIAFELKQYVVQTTTTIIQRCMLMTTDPGDVVFDPTCGSGTTAAVAEQWGRRWITCDTSRVAVTIAKQRLMTSSFDYYELTNENDGVDGGLRYKTVPHVTLRNVANSDAAVQEALYDKPIINPDKVRVTGPFTVEAVPAPMVAEMSTESAASGVVNSTIGRSGSTQRHDDWRDELLKTGARGHGGALIKFSRVEPLAGTRYLHAEAETIEDKPRRVVISFGPDYQPLEQRQVEVAWEEARSLDPRPDIVLFAAFQFDPEAAKDIDEMPAAVTKKTTFLKAQMNPDLLTEDLKKKRASNQSFWLVGRPDVEVIKVSSGEDKGKYRVAVLGFDYYDVKTGEIQSGDSGRIAMWMLDPDYDGRSLFPRQVFFPNAGVKDGWNRLAKTLRSELDEELLEQYLGTESLAFQSGHHRRAAVKIIDNRGIESLRVLDLP